MIPYFYPYQSVSFVFLCSVFLLITILLSLRMSYLLLSHDNDRDSVAQFSKTRVREFALKVQVGNNIKRGKYYKEQREVTSFSLCLYLITVHTLLPILYPPCCSHHRAKKVEVL